MASWPSRVGPGTTGSGSSHAVMERAWWKVRRRARRTWGRLLPWWWWWWWWWYWWQNVAVG